MKESVGQFPVGDGSEIAWTLQEVRASSLRAPPGARCPLVFVLFSLYNVIFSFLFDETTCLISTSCNRHRRSLIHSLS